MTDPRDTEPVEAADAGKAEAQVSGERPDPLAEAQREAAEFKDKALRTLAEMENLRKRTEREVADARLYGNRQLCPRRVGGGRQHAARARRHRARAARNDAKVKSLIEGVELTERELLKVLGKHGVKKFSPDGEKFDPNVHQAMFEMEHAELPPGHVAQVIQAGYMLGDRVLRPAMVAVVKAAPKQQAASANGNSADAG